MSLPDNIEGYEALQRSRHDLVAFLDALASRDKELCLAAIAGLQTEKLQLLHVTMRLLQDATPALLKLMEYTMEERELGYAREPDPPAPSELPRMIGLPMSEDEVRFYALALNLASSVVSGDLVNQLRFHGELSQHSAAWGLNNINACMLRFGAVVTKAFPELTK